MSDETSTEMTVRDQTEDDGGGGDDAQKLPAPSSIEVPAALLLAAEMTSASGDPGRPYLESVFLHSRDGRGVVAGTDGKRLFVGSFALPEVPPDWLADGVLLSNEHLRPRVAMIAKFSDDVRVTWSDGTARVTLATPDADIAFQLRVVAGSFPEYHRVVGADSFGTWDGEGRATGREWEPVGINSAFLKQCGDIAKVLEAGLPKENRSDGGMIVRAFHGSADAPLVFDFSTWPGAILVVGTARLATPAVSAETALLLTPALRMSVGALRAHVTRHMMRAKEAPDEATRLQAEAEAAEYQARIADILKRLPSPLRLELEGSTAHDLERVEKRRVKRAARKRARAMAKFGVGVTTAEAETEAETEASDDDAEGQAEAEAAE